MVVAMCAFGVVGIVWRLFDPAPIWLNALPVAVEWPTLLPDEASSNEPTLTSAVISDASATIANLSFGTKLVLAFGELISVALVLVPAMLIAVLGRHVRRGAPFPVLASKALTIAAITVLVAGLAGDIVGDIGATLAAAEALSQRESGAAATDPGLFTLTLQLWPIGAALALGALAAVFRQGAALQRETEGLV